MAESKGMKRIKRMARMAGINPSTKTISNVRMFMEVYRDLNRVSGRIKTMVKPISISEACPVLFRGLLQLDEIEEEVVEELECRFIADGWFQNIANEALEDVKDFEEEGLMYHQILDSNYFLDDVEDEDEFMQSMGLSRSVYYSRKREATLLYGTFFWGKLLNEWPNAVEEMRAIEEECGREDEFSRELRIGKKLNVY